MSDNGKDNEVKSQSSSDEAQKKLDLDDTISRLLRRTAVVDSEEDGDAEE